MLNETNLLQRISDLDHVTSEMLDEARTAGDIRAALQAVRESRGNVEAYARLGALSDLEARLRALEVGAQQQKGT